MRRLPALLACFSLALFLGHADAIKMVQAQVAIAVGPGGAPAEEAPATDEEILKKAKLTDDGPTLLNYFRKRTLLDVDRKHMEALVEKLGSEDFEVRTKPGKELVALGARALPLLREAEQKNPDVEVQRHAEHCRVLIEGEGGAAVSAAAARVVAKKNPAGATKVLLAYLRFAEDENVRDELRKALAAVGVKGGKPDPALVKALHDRLPVKRAAAADALCRANVKDELPEVHKLLKDKDPEVRLHAALGLAPHKDKEAVTTLIKLLADLKEEEAWPAEELLVRLAGEHSPGVPLGTDEASRKECSEAWAKWWQANKDKVDLARASRVPRLKGYTLIVQRDLVWRGGRFQTGMVKELDLNKKVRWKIGNLKNPVDAQVFTAKDGKEHVLVAEWQGNEVTERDLKGKVLWTHKINWPVACQRLPGGHTFIATQNQLVEVDAKGKEVFSRQFNNVMKARKLPGGDIVVLTNVQTVSRLVWDAKAKSYKDGKTFNVGGWVQQFSDFEVLPTGRVLVPVSGMNDVCEFNPDGKKVADVRTNWPTTAQRLPNGHTLVGSQSTNQVVELDRKGKVVWQHANTDGQVYVARRR